MAEPEKTQSRLDKIKMMNAKDAANWYFKVFWPKAPHCDLAMRCDDKDDCVDCLVQWLEEEGDIL